MVHLVEVLCYKPEGGRFDSPQVSMEFFIDLILPATLHSVAGRITRNISWGVKVHRTDNLTTFMCQLS